MAAKAITELTEVNLSDFGSIRNYGEHIKELITKCADAGGEIPEWIQSTLFIKGLGEELEEYVSQLVNLYEYTGKELSFDAMVAALVDREEIIMK